MFIIMRVDYDLKFNVLQTPPTINVMFADIADDESEIHGRTSFDGAASQEIWDDIADGVPMLDAIKTGIAKQAAAFVEPGAIATRITDAVNAEKRARVAAAEIEALNARCDAVRAAEAASIATRDAASVEALRLDSEIAAKRAELATLEPKP